MRGLGITGGVAGAALLIAGCSLLNSFDEVQQQPGDAGNGASGAAGSGGIGTDASGSGGAGTDAGGAGGSAGAEGGSGGLDAGAEAGGAGGEGGSGGAAPSQGLVVVGGVQPSGESVLSVIDPTDGRELDREQLPSGVQVAAIAYDGAPGRDLWFIFTASEFPAREDRPADLEVRRFDDQADAWERIASFTALPPPFPRSAVALNDRLAYLSFKTQDNAVVSSISILDTSDPGSVSEVSFTPTALAEGETRIGLLGTRGTAANPNSVGGTLNVAVESGCASDICDLRVRPISIGTLVTEQVPELIGSYRGVPAFASSQVERRSYFLLPPVSGSATVYRAAPDALDAAEALVVGTTVSEFGGMALLDCREVPSFTAVNEETLGAASLASGLVGSVPLGRTGTLVAREPFTGHIIAAFAPEAQPDAGAPDAGGSDAGAPDAGAPPPALGAFRVTTNATVTTVSVARVTEFEPPADLEPRVLATRFPLPHECE